MLPCSNDEQEEGESEPLIPWKGEPAVHSPFCYAKGGASPPAAWAPPRGVDWFLVTGQSARPASSPSAPPGRPVLLHSAPLAPSPCVSLPVPGPPTPPASSSPPRRRLHLPARHIVLSHHASRCSPHHRRSMTRSHPVARAAVAGSGSADASPVPLTSALASRRGIGKYPPLSAPSGPGSSSPRGEAVIVMIACRPRDCTGTRRPTGPPGRRRERTKRAAGWQSEAVGRQHEREEQEPAERRPPTRPERPSASPERSVTRT